jgi:hypothetical protein
MVEIEPGCFKEPKEEALPKLEKHLNYFIAHVTKYKGYINADIKNYLFFNSKVSLSLYRPNKSSR